MVTDALAEIGGSLFGKQNIRVLGHRRRQPQVGGRNRRRLLAARLILCLVVVHGTFSGRAVDALAVIISISNTLLELFSPRGTDDFTMATANALICWAFGVLLI